MTEVFISSGLIGPWVTDNIGSDMFNLTEFYMTEHDYAIEIVQPGLYMIYSQVNTVFLSK